MEAPRRGERQASVYTGTKPAGCPALSGTARKASALKALPTAGHGVHKPSGRWRSQPVWDRRHPRPLGLPRPFRLSG